MPSGNTAFLSCAPAADVDVADAVVHHADLGRVAPRILPLIIAFVIDSVAVLGEAVSLPFGPGDKVARCQ